MRSKSLKSKGQSLKPRIESPRFAKLAGEVRELKEQAIRRQEFELAGRLRQSEQLFTELSLVRRCRRCGCTQHNACFGAGGPCCWAERDLCSQCLTGAEFRRWMRGEKRPSRGKE